jgi:hypothetical protein
MVKLDDLVKSGCLVAASLLLLAASTPAPPVFHGITGPAASGDMSVPVLAANPAECKAQLNQCISVCHATTTSKQAKTCVLQCKQQYGSCMSG